MWFPVECRKCSSARTLSNSKRTFVVARQVCFSLIYFIVVARQYKRKLFDHYISVLAATMSDSEEPMPNTPLDEVPASEIGEPLPAPLATVEQGQEMEVIWRMVNMVTPTKGTNSNQLKKYWSEFMARFRHYQNPLGESRTLLVVCHIPATT